MAARSPPSFATDYPLGGRHDRRSPTLEGNIHVNGAMKMVWFKDPDGNILHLNNI